MSYDLELATERAIDRLRGIASSHRRDGDDWIADALTEIADSLARPLADVKRARAREAERQKAERLWQP